MPTAEEMIQIPVLRAAYYLHEEDESFGAITKLPVDRLRVAADVTDGLVTIAGAEDDPGYGDGCGVEYDLDPASARRLAALLVKAAAKCEAKEHAGEGSE